MEQQQIKPLMQAVCIEHKLLLVEGKCEKCVDKKGKHFVLDMQSYFLRPYQNDKSEIIWDECTKSLKLVCNNELWNFLQDIRNKGLDNLDIIQVAKIYKQLKSLKLE